MQRVVSVAFLLAACATVILTWPAAPSSANSQEAPAEGARQKKLLRHVVLFKFKKSASKEQVQEVVDAFAALPKKIDTIVEFEMGTDVSVENKSKGFTHGFVVTFNDEAGRKTYLPHPAHKEFVKIVGPVLEDVLVFDYWTTR